MTSEISGFVDVTIIPAMPGTMVVYTHEEDERSFVTPDEMDVLLAWRMETVDHGDGDGLVTYVIPIVQSGCISQREYGVVRNDGVVDCSAGHSFSDVSSFLADARLKVRAKAISNAALEEG